MSSTGGVGQQRDLGRLLSPRSIVLVGVSHKGGASRGLLKNLVDYGGTDDLYLVNPNGGEIEGIRCHRSVRALGKAVDLALVVAPADRVADVVEECGHQGIGAAVVFSAGFEDDRGPAGRDRHAALTDAARRTGIRLLGPNCLGFFNVERKVAATWSTSVAHDAVAGLTATGAPPSPLAGRADPVAAAVGPVAIVAQSGGLGFSLFNRGLGRGLRFSYVISAGNEADLEVQDFVEFLLDDDTTRVILLYVEGLKDPGRFQALAARAEGLGKRIVIAKVGRSAVAARAALSHTGHLAGDDAAFDAVFDRYGIVRVHDQDEMLDVALALSACPLPRGPRAAIVSYSGGNGVWMADACDHHGIELPELSPAIQRRLDAVLPSFAATTNPVDISGASRISPAEVLTVVADDPVADALLLIRSYSHPASVAADRPALEQLAQHGTKPVLVYSYTEPSADAHAALRQIGIPTFTSTARCARALRALVTVGTHRDEPAPAPIPQLGRVRRLVERWNPDAATVAEHATKRFLREAGLRTTRETLATSAADAVIAASGLGYPVALKVQSPDIPHKAREAGVVLAVPDAGAVERAFAAIVAGARRARPTTDLDGILVQEMVPSGVELLVGVDNTSPLGPMVMVGLGGPLAEVVGRTALYPAPFGHATARALVGRLGIEPVLAAQAPGDPAAIVDRLAELVAVVSQLADALRDHLLELDLNPVMVDPRSGEPVVVDALAVPVPDRLVPTLEGADQRV